MLNGRPFDVHRLQGAVIACNPATGKPNVLAVYKTVYT